MEKKLVKTRADKRLREPPASDDEEAASSAPTKVTKKAKAAASDDEEAASSAPTKVTKKAKAAAIDVEAASPTMTPASEELPQETPGDEEGDEAEAAKTTLEPLADAAAAAKKGRSTMTALAMKTKGIAVKKVKVPPVTFSGVNLPAPAANPSSSSSSSSARPATRHGGSSSSSSSSAGP